MTVIDASPLSGIYPLTITIILAIIIIIIIIRHIMAEGKNDKE